MESSGAPMPSIPTEQPQPIPESVMPNMGAQEMQSHEVSPLSGGGAQQDEVQRQIQETQAILAQARREAEGVRSAPKENTAHIKMPKKSLISYFTDLLKSIFHSLTFGAFKKKTA